MKSNILFALLLILKLQTGIAQCNTKKDEFTGEAVTKYHKNYFANYVVDIETKHHLTTFQFDKLYTGQITSVISKGTHVMLKLENGDIIKLITIMDCAPKPILMDNSVYTSFLFVFEINDMILEKLAISKIVLMRLPNPSTENTTVDIGEKGELFTRHKKLLKAILAGAKCMTGK